MWKKPQGMSNKSPRRVEKNLSKQYGKLNRKSGGGGTRHGTKCCQLLQNACKCSIYIRICICFRIFICIYIRNCSRGMLCCICDILRTFRHIALHFLNKMCTIFKQEGGEGRRRKGCCVASLLNYPICASIGILMRK